MNKVVNVKICSPRSMYCHGFTLCVNDRCSANRARRILSANIPIGVAMTKESAAQSPLASTIAQSVFAFNFFIQKSQLIMLA